MAGAGRSFGGEPVSVLAVKYAKSFSGDGARIFIQLAYFYLLANTLTIGEFGLFATASSVGIVLSRLAAFGFLSPLYRIATVKPQLIGTYTAGFLAALALSLPLIAAIAVSAHAIFFAAMMPLVVFGLIVATEVLFWRSLEVVIIVLKGLEQFGRASILIVFGFAMKAIAAAVLAFGQFETLADWSVIYFSTQAVMAACAIVFFYPRRRLRFRPRLYLRRLRDSLAVCGSDILFYIQMELDKLVVLTLGGEVAAGLYAMVMRLVDLTAMPVRTFSVLLTQRLMRTPQLLTRLRVRMGFEVGVFLVSCLGLTAMAGVFWVKPDILGDNVARAGALLFAVLAVPAFRNAIEYHAELLYGRGQTVIKLINYALIGALKAVLLVAVLTMVCDQNGWFIWFNAVFGVMYLASLALTYSALRRPPVRV